MTNWSRRQTVMVRFVLREKGRKLKYTNKTGQIYIGRHVHKKVNVDFESCSDLLNYKPSVGRKYKMGDLN